MKFKILSFLFSQAVVITLFCVMGLLIFQNSQLKKKVKDNININFLRNYKERDVENMNRKKPVKPKEPVKAPKAPKVSVNKPQKQKLLKMQSFNTQFDASAVGKGLAVGGYGGDSSGDRDLIPIIMVQPQFPTRARIEGIEGFVGVMYDVNEKGFVENIRVLESKPPRLFDQAVIRALLASRFKPRVVNGKAVAVKNLVRKMEMSLEAN